MVELCRGTVGGEKQEGARERGGWSGVMNFCVGCEPEKANSIHLMHTLSMGDQRSERGNWMKIVLFSWWDARGPPQCVERETCAEHVEEKSWFSYFKKIAESTLRVSFRYLHVKIIIRAGYWTWCVRALLAKVAITLRQKVWKVLEPLAYAGHHGIIGLGIGNQSRTGLNL